MHQRSTHRNNMWYAIAMFIVCYILVGYNCREMILPLSNANKNINFTCNIPFLLLDFVEPLQTQSCDGWFRL